MAQVVINETTLNGIATAIRNKNGSSTVYRPSQMPSAINDIETYPEPTGSISITENGTTNVKNYALAVVNVPNTYEASDEGKVVSSGTLVSQTSTNVTANGTYDTTTNNEVVVEVENSYSASDEGKVVSNGALISQGSQTITENGTYDTTEKNVVTVSVSGGSGSIMTGSTAPTSDMGDDGDYYEQTIPIPSNVNFVEYLQSSGTQYINTGIYATQDIDAIVTGDRSSGTGSGVTGCMFGVRTGSFSSMSKVLYFGSHTDNSGGVSVIKSGSAVSGTLANVTGVSTRRTKTYRQENDYIVYSSTIDELATYSKLYRQSGEWVSDMPLCMFAFYNGTTLNNAGGTKVHRVTILEKGAPIADYLPCLDGDGVACMWENVSGQYVYNDGTGDFTYGSTVTPDALDSVLWHKVSGSWEVVG